MKKKLLSAAMAAAMAMSTVVVPASAVDETITKVYQPENYIIRYGTYDSNTEWTGIAVNQTPANVRTDQDQFLLQYSIAVPSAISKVTLQMPGLKLPLNSSDNAALSMKIYYSTIKKDIPDDGLYYYQGRADESTLDKDLNGDGDKEDKSVQFEYDTPVGGTKEELETLLTYWKTFMNAREIGSEVAATELSEISASAFGLENKAYDAFDAEKDITESVKSALINDGYFELLYSNSGNDKRQDYPAWATGTTVEVEYSRAKLVEYINGSSGDSGLKSRLAECAELLDIDMSIYEDVSANAFDAYAGEIDTYAKLEEMLEELTPQSVKDAMPFYKPVTLDYNVSNLFTDNSAPTSGGQIHSSNGYICAQEFKDQNIWKNTWTDGMTENTLTANGVDFKMKVESGAKATTAISAVPKALDQDSKWKTIDMENMKYTSVDLLCYGALGADWTSTSIKLNYTDGTSSIWESGTVVLIDKDPTTQATAQGKLGIKIRIGNDSTALATIKDGYFAHYSIQTNDEKILNNIQILSAEYNLQYDNNGGYTEILTAEKDAAGTLDSFEKATNIHAITGVTTVGEENKRLEEERLNAPAYEPVDLSAKYNVHHLFSDTAYAGGNAHGSNGYIKTSSFKTPAAGNTYSWDTPWQDGMTENTLTANGVKFKLKVVDVADEDHKNEYVAVAATGLKENDKYIYMDENSKWMTIDMKDMKYTSVDFLAYFALSSSEWGTTSVRLNYKDSEPDYWNSGNVANIGTDPTANTSTYKVYGKLDVTYGEGNNVNSITEKSGYISHYRIPTDNTKVLESISILNGEYDLDENNNPVLANSKTAEGSLNVETARKVTNIHAITGVTTVKEQNSYVEPNILEFTPSITVEADKVTANLSMVNTTASKADYILIITAYDVNNRLVGVKASAQKELAAGTGKTTGEPLEMDIPATATSYKAMVWNSIAGMTPYVAAETNP